jgi:peptidoglycan/LPS O-acetylase OafA/YrhL
LKSVFIDQRLASLDGLRGVAALFVLFSHLSNQGLSIHPVLNFSGSGKYGVFLFFVLSAFLLSRQSFQSPSRQLYSGRFWLRYALRRVLRIFPLFIFVLVCTAVLTNVFRADFVILLSWGELGRHLLLQQGKSIFWTIPVEFKYYIILPAAVFVLHGFVRGRVWLGTACVLMAIVAVESLWPASRSEMNGIALGPYLSIFLFGTLTALVYARLQTLESRIKRYGWMLEVVAFMAFAAVLTTVPHWWNALRGSNIAPSYFHRSYSLYGLLWSVFILSHLHGRGFFRWVLSSRPMRMVGAVSFSMYLWHRPIILLVEKHVPTTNAAKIAIILASTLIISLISYRLIELPFLQLGRKKRETADSAEN